MEDVVVYGTFAYGYSRNHATVHGETGIDKADCSTYIKKASTLPQVGQAKIQIGINAPPNSLCIVDR